MDSQRPEHALILSHFEECNIPVFAIHRLVRLAPTAERGAVLQGWIDLELSLDDGNYTRERERVSRCILDWRQARASDPDIIWSDARPFVQFRLLPREASVDQPVRLGSREVSDVGHRFGALHYSIDLRDGSLSEMAIGSNWRGRYELVEEMREALVLLLAAASETTGMRVGVFTAGCGSAGTISMSYGRTSRSAPAGLLFRHKRAHKSVYPCGSASTFPHGPPVTSRCCQRRQTQCCSGRRDFIDNSCAAATIHFDQGEDLGVRA